jgi:zinc protease
MRAVFVAAIVAMAAPAVAKPAAATTKAFPFPTEMHTLPNGLRVVFVPYDSPGLVAYYTLMRVGSRNEPEPGRSGYAHFFEHMMFRGTPTHSGDEYNQTVTKLGLNTNAFTGNDMTVYTLYGPSKALPTIIDYEADRFQHLDYTEEQFKTEAGAILGEYAKSASDPEMILEEKMMETAFTKHTYRHTTIGYLDDVKAMPSGFAYSREFFRRYYTPDDAIIFVAGDFDRNSTLHAIEQAYGSWKGKADAVKVPAEPKQQKSKRAQVNWDKPTLPRLWIAWHTPGAGDIRSAAVQNLLNAYLFGPTSPLYQNLVLGKQLVDSMEPTYSDHRDPNLFGVLLRVKDAKNLKAVEHAILIEIKSLAGGKLDAKRFEAVRSNLRYSNIMGLDTADAAALSEAVNAALTADVNYLNKEFEALAQLQPKDLQTFAKGHFMDLNRTTVTLTSTSRRGAR